MADVKFKLSIDGGDIVMSQIDGVTGSLNATSSASDKAAAASDRFLESLKSQANVASMSRTELLSHQAAMLGVSSSAQPFIDSIAKASEHTEKFGFATARSKTELLVLAHEMSQGNYQRFGGSMMVLGEQTGAAGLLFSGAGLAALGLAAAAGVAAYAMIKGAGEQKAMNDALIMTGNYAGLTSNQLNGLAHAAVDTGGSLSEAKKIVTELAASGKYTGEQIGTVTEAVIAVEHATGGTDKSVEKLVKQFESLAVQAGAHSKYSDDISKATVKLDDEYHFLTVSVYDQIRALEREGEQKAASKLATDEFAKANKERAEEIVANLGNIARGWNSVKESIGGAIDKMGEWGKKATPQSNLAAQEATLSSLQQWQTDSQGGANGLENSRASSAVAAQLEVVIAARKELFLVNERAAAQGAAALVMSDANHAAATISALDLKYLKKGQSELTVEMDKYHDAIAKRLAQDPEYAKKNADEISAMEAAITKAHTATVGKEKAQSDANNTIAASIAKVNEAALLELDTGEKLSAADKFRITTLGQIDEALRKHNITLAQSIERKKDEAVAEGNMVSAAARIQAIKDEDEATRNYAKQIDGLGKIRDADLAKLDNAIAKQKEHNDQVGLSKEKIDQLKASQDDQLTAELQKQAQVIDLLLTKGQVMGANGMEEVVLGDRARGLYEQELDGLNRTISKRKELSLAYQDGAIKDAANAAEKTWEQSSKNISDGLYNAISMGGGNAVKKLMQDMKNWFARLVLSPIINPIASFGASLLNPSAASAAGGSGLLGQAGSAAGIYNATGSLGFLGAAGSGFSAGSTLGAAGLGGDAIGAGFSMMGSATGASSFMAGAGQALGAAMGAIGPVGWAVLAGIAVASIFGGGGPKQVNSTGIEGSFGSGGFTGNNFSNWTQDGGWFGSNSSGHDTSALAAATATQFNTAYSALQSSATAAATALGLSSTAIANYSENISVKLTGDATKDQAIITQLFSDLSDHMANAVAPGLAALAKDGETAGTTLLRLSTSITTANAWLSMLHNRLFDISLGGADAASKLADAFGGLNNLTTASQAFYDLYYTAGEKAARSQADMTAALAAVNLSLPTTMDGLKAMAGSLDLNTDAGRAAYAVLLTIAPVFASTADAIAKLSSDSAAKLMATFTGGGQLPPALDATRLKMDSLTTATGAMTGSLSYINAVMGNTSSGVITFGSSAAALNTGLTASQLSAGMLNGQLVALQDHADKTRIDFMGLGAALAGANTETFVATMGLVFDNLAKRIQGTIDAISAERTAVANAALQIINPTVMSKTAIQQGIAGINTALPGNAGIITAANSLAQAQALQGPLDQWKAGMAYTAAQGSALVAQATKAVVDAQAQVDASSANLQALQAAAAPGAPVYARTGGGGDAGFDYYWVTDPGSSSAQAALPGAIAAQANAQSLLKAAQDAAQAAQAKAVTMTDSVTAAPYTQSYVDVQNAAAVAQAKTAQLAYAAAMQSFAIDASNSVGKLTTLREETVKYYNAQKQLADLMTASAAGLRSTVDSYNFSQKTPQQQLADLQSQYSAAYSTAMSVQGDGATLASYGDKLNTLLSPLIAKLQETGNQSLISSYLAQADSVATLIEKVIPVNYQQDSLDMLGTIDTTLAALDNSSQSAEKVISDAVNAGSDKTAAGLHAVIAALTGQSIPAFASGGDFAGGLRIVGENGPELEATGPSRIFSAAQTRSMLQGGPSGNTARLEALVEALTQEVANLRLEARATAVATTKFAKQFDRLAPAGDALSTRAVV